MRALALEDFDRPAAVIDVPVPVPGPGEVLVKVHAASVNAYDTFVAMGMMKDYMAYEFPAVLGGDVAGVVEVVGADVDGFTEGDRVFGMIGMKPAVHDGTFGQFAAAQASSLAPIPDGLDDVQAGCLGVAGTTAASAVDALGVATGSIVLVWGATGGVGSFTIQLASGQGAHVIASVRSGDEDFVRGLGAAETMDYEGDLLGTVRARYPVGIGALIDLVHREEAEFAAAAGVVRDGGTAVSAVGGAGESSSIGGVKVANVSGDPSRLAELAELVGRGQLTAAITRNYALEDAASALEDFTREHTLGKHVIQI